MDTCHECCNTVTKLIKEANDERYILESKFYHSLKFNKVLLELLRYKMFGRFGTCRNLILHKFSRTSY